ncbi:hypothetical protein KR038_004037 [Drosophila bunnanda]|nr:hypothetical protein KR038_004037 [Drosophila bunnanda]
MLQGAKVGRQLAKICGFRYYTNQEVAGSLKSTYLKGHVRLDPVNVLPKSYYGGIHTVTLYTGSSIIGQQGAKFVNSLLQSSRVPVEVQPIDQEDEYYKSVLRNRAAVHVDIHADEKSKARSLKICNDLDLYVFKSRMRSFPGYKGRFPCVDIQMIGQNNMGNYSELEYSPVDGVVEALSVVTQAANRKYLEHAFAAAAAAGRSRVTLVNKAKEWPLNDGALVEEAKKIHSKYEDLELELMEVEDCVSLLVTNPARFDCLFASDRYATFLATICSGVCGGANLFSAVEIGDNHAVFKPLQTKLSLTNYSNLSAYGIISTIADLLEYLGHQHCSEALWAQMLRTMDEGIRTVEFGGKDSDEFVICNINNKLKCLGLGGNKEAAESE